MDPMDYQMESEDLAAQHHQSRAPQSRCPYRAANTADAPMFNYAAFHHQPHPFHSTNPAHFNNGASAPGPLWDNVVRTNLPSYHTLNSGFGTSNNGGNLQGRAPEIANFDSFMHPLDPRAPVYHAQSRAPQESNRPPPPPTQAGQGNDQGSRGAGSHANGARNSNHSSFSSNQSPSRIPDVMSRPDWGSGQFDMTLPMLNNPRSQITLPPPQPQFPYQDLYMNNQYHMSHQSRFIPNLDHPSASQNSAPPLASQPAPPREQPAHTRSANGHEHQYRRFGDYTLSHDDDDDYSEDDDDLLETAFFAAEGLNGLSDNAAARYLTRVSGSSRRDLEPAGQREMFLERSRAARRAAAASVKLVASASALASFEKVSKESLKVDDQTCIICYNEFGIKNPDGFVESAVRLPKCKHLFGDHCLKQWLKDSNTCPYCRDKLDSEPKRNGSVSEARRMMARDHRVREGPGGTWQLPEEYRQHDETYLALMDYEHGVRARFNRMPYSGTGHQAEDNQTRHRFPENVTWTSLHPSQTSPTRLNSSESSADTRRRFRGRHTASRASPQGPGRGSARPNRNSLGSNLRVTMQDMLDNETSPQRRSITPYPTAETSNRSTPLVASPTSSARPSSLPSTRSPLGEATETPPATLGGRSLSNNANNVSLPQINSAGIGYPLWAQTENGPRTNAVRPPRPSSAFFYRQPSPEDFFAQQQSDNTNQSR